MIAEEGEIQYFSRNAVNEHGCSKYALLDSLRVIVQRIFSTTNCNITSCSSSHSGLVALVEVLEQIFTQGLLPGYGWNQDINFPGFLTILQWCLDSDGENDYQMSTIRELQQSLCMCSKSEGASEIHIVVNVLVNEGSLGAIICLLKSSDPISENYQSSAFMKNATCYDGLLTCLNAFHRRSVGTLSEFPLPMLKLNFVALVQVPGERIHVSDNVRSPPPVPESVPTPEAALPDIVVCSKSAPEDSDLINRNVDSLSELHDNDDFPSPSNDISEDSEYGTSFEECSQENAQLHLSELLITVIQGRNCGLSNPDLLECVDKAVPHMSAPHGETLMEKASSSIKNFCESGVHSGWDRSASIDDESLSGLDAGHLEWCVPSDEVPQSLLPVPDAVKSVNDPEMYSEKQSALLDLSPIVSVTHPILSKKQALLSQKYKCFGCGTCLHDSRGGFSRCELLNFYFCLGCHDNRTKRVLPARIFHHFDFKRYKVSKVASILLDEIHCEPIFNLKEINPDVYTKSKRLSACHDLRINGSRLLKNLESCPEPWNYHDSMLMVKLNKLPLHILRTSPTIFSISDMIQIKSGRLCKQLNVFIDECHKHMTSCNLCSAN